MRGHSSGWLQSVRVDGENSLEVRRNRSCVLSFCASKFVLFSRLAAIPVLIGGRGGWKDQSRVVSGNTVDVSSFCMRNSWDELCVHSLFSLFHLISHKKHKRTDTI